MKPGVYTKEVDLSSVWICSCHRIGFKTEYQYLSHIRSIKLNKIRSKISS